MAKGSGALATVAIVIIAVPVVIVTALTGASAPSSATDCTVTQSSAASTSATARPSTSASNQVPTSGGSGVALMGLDAEAQSNARAIAAVLLQLALPAQALVIAEMTALTESGLHNISYGDTAGPDSRGLFQQRDSWGPLAIRMDPAGATGLFLDRLLTVPNWTMLPAWVAAQAVEHSSHTDGSNYKANYAQGLAIATQLYGAPGATVQCATGQGQQGAGPVPVTIATLPAAAAPYTGPADGGACTTPDAGGCIRQVTAYGREAALTALGSLIRSVGCYYPVADHGNGVACDFMITTGAAAQGQDLVNGWTVAAWFRANAQALHVAYIIWELRIWDERHPAPDDSGGWGQPYDGCSYCPPVAGNPSASHTNHVHVSFQSPVTQ